MSKKQEKMKDRFTKLEKIYWPPSKCKGRSSICNYCFTIQVISKNSKGCICVLCIIVRSSWIAWPLYSYTFLHKYTCQSKWLWSLSVSLIPIIGLWHFLLSKLKFFLCHHSFFCCEGDYWLSYWSIGDSSKKCKFGSSFYFLKKLIVCWIF